MTKLKYVIYAKQAQLGYKIWKGKRNLIVFSVLIVLALFVSMCLVYSLVDLFRS